MTSIDRSEIGSLLNLSNDIIPESNQNRSGRPIAPTHITIHNTSNTNPGANASAHARFVKNKGYYELSSGRRNYVSWHYTVDDVQVIKHLPVNERAIHAGRGNGVSIGIEICMHAGIDQAAANLRAQRLVAVLMHDLRIPSDNIQTHKYWTDKACPTLILSSFSNFRAGCEEIRSSIGTAIEVTEVAPLTIAEIEDVLHPSAEAEAEASVAPEDDPLEEHDLIASEVDAFIE